MRTTTVLLAASLLAGTALPAFADQPGADWMPLDRAYRLLTEAGYRDVTEIEADDGRWEAKATKDGVPVEVEIEPRTGALTAKPRKP